MRIRLIFRLGSPFSRHKQLQTDIFGRILPPQRRPLLPLFGSLVVHGALLVLIPFVADEVAKTYSDDIDWSAYRVELMRLRVPDVIYYAAPTRRLSPNASARSKGGPSAEQRKTHDVVAQGSNTAISLPKGIELPSLQAGETESAILQPDATKPRHPATLPPLAFWGRKSSEPKPSRNQVTLPGRAEDADSPPQLAAPPVLAVPNKEFELADKNIAAAPPVAAASLPVAPSAVAPLREKSSEPRSGAMDQFRGQSANVISLSSAPIRPGEVVSVPPGSSSLRPSRTAAGEAVAGAAPETATPATNSARAQMGHETSASAAAPSQEPPSHRDSPGTADGSAQQQRRSVPAAALPPNRAETGAKAAEPGGSESFKRIMHPPNGNFDVVVTQSASSDLQGIAARLSGSPVYTVYLQVGDVKEWVLAFCAPAAKQSRNSSYQVFVEDAAPLSAPYPITTAIPESIVGQPRPTQLVFRGFLTASGTLRDLVATEPSATAQKVAIALREWQFRPARRDHTPTEVEVLLIVPPLQSAMQARRQVPYNHPSEHRGL